MTATLEKQDIIPDVAPPLWDPPDFMTIDGESHDYKGAEFIGPDYVHIFYCDNREWVALFDQYGRAYQASRRDEERILDEIKHPETMVDPWTGMTIEETRRGREFKQCQRCMESSATAPCVFCH